nr:dystroglycan-like [Leptinotarsa decemlineata]XP_023019899.1 dystroglycan-like [Leptinotarsa decemlineata]
MDFRIPVAMLLAIAILLAPIVVADNEDFAFDVADDLQVEFEGGRLLKWSERELTAYVGRAFHLIVPKEAFEGNVKYFEAKKHSGKSIPSWLLFDKKQGVFWGVPLVQDVGEVQLTVKATGDKKSSEEIKINVVEPSEEAPGVGKCQANEDNTILTLLLDKSIRSIKPKQRVIAINNIAKFFGLPYSAFTLKPQIEKDDITDSSVVLAGPGNLQSKTSKVISLLQVAVGCDGRLWLSTASMVHQLKQQARDGTIAEVLRLPLIGWRIKTETKPIVRSKRQITGEIDDYGSGDYNDDDDYYDDYEEYDVDGLEDIEKSPPSTKTPVTSTTLQTTSGTTETTTHPHRHHHGDKNKSNPNMHYQTTNNNHTYEERIPVTSSSTSHRTEPTTTTTTTSTSTTTPQPPSIGVTKAIKPDDVLSYGDDNYDYGEYDDEDDIDDAVESETIVPDQTGRSKQTFVPPFEDTESMTTEETTIKTTAKEISPETQPTIWNSTTSTSTTTTPTTTTATTTTTTTTTTTPPSTISISTTTTATPTEAPTTFQIVVENDPQIDYTSETEKPATTTSEATTPIETTEATTTTMPPPPPPPPTTTTTTSTTTSTTTTTTELPTTQTETTSTTEILTTQKSTASIRDFTEIENQRNFNPFIENRLQQMSVIAGKVFRFVIPHNTFKDFEDEYNLTYQLLDSNNRTVTNNSWLYFNPSRREIYGLPLEEDVSKWVFWVKAFDREGGSEQEKLNIQVQQHKLDLVVNHEFSVYIRIEKHQEFSHYVDWSLRVLRALGKIFNTNMSEITVRRINYTNEPVTFTWSNDSIPTNYCAKNEIEELFKTLTANDRGDPSRELNHALAPELRVKKVTFRELGVCEQPMTPVTPPMNFSPILRNPVDHVNATVGELLVYKVKDDTFYDPEDVDPRMLNISLLTGDRQPIPPDNWLQFDNKNREFFGIPRKVGRSEYQLICVDSGGLPATDSLEVFVYPAAKTPYNVEFSMTINELPHETFINSASLQKKFVEKLVDLFGESSASNIHLLPFKKTDDSTIVTWFNKSLATNRCPQEKIKYLESVLHNMNDKSISHKVHSIMEPEFQVSTIKVNLIGNCRPRVTQEMKPEGGVSTEETTPQSSSDEYLITFIVPAIIISIMLFLAIIAAIVLYRRKRMGKMNVEEDGRQSYGNKGIPVIFQEELEEKPEPGTKAPVILKDEKPPLAPPEYSKSGSVKLSDDSEPYQPPPPFTRTQDNGRQPRPKPTPTYRKPPPYVPP